MPTSVLNLRLHDMVSRGLIQWLMLISANVRLGLLLALYPRVVFVARLTSRRQSLAIVTRCVVRCLRWASRQGHMIAGFMQQLLESERLLSEGVLLTMKDPKGCDWGHLAVALALWEFTVEQNRAQSTVSSLPRALWFFVILGGLRERVLEHGQCEVNGTRA